MSIEDIIFICLAALAAVILISIVLVILIRIVKRKKEKSKVKEQKEFDLSMKKFEAQNFRYCRRCGGKVQKDDNICPHCRNIP